MKRCEAGGALGALRLVMCTRARRVMKHRLEDHILILAGERDGLRGASAEQRDAHKRAYR